MASFDIDHPIYGSEHPYACDDLLPRYRMTEADATAELRGRLRRLIREHIAVYAADPARARWLDKTHAYSLKVPLLESILADCDPRFSAERDRDPGRALRDPRRALRLRPGLRAPATATAGAARHRRD